MKGIMKNINLSKISFQQMIELINIGMEVNKSYIELLKEKEKTKQVAIETEVRITESNNRLVYEMEKLQKEMLEIKCRFERDAKELDDKFESNKQKLYIIERLIDNIERNEKKIEEYDLSSPFVMEFFEKLHQEKLYIMNLLLG